MYERFDDKARELVKDANLIAGRWNHEYLGTEHMLLALIAARNSEAYHVLRIMGIPAEIMATEVQALIMKGPDIVVLGKIPHTPRMKRVIEYAVEEARNAASQTVGTEHVLLGLIREPEGVAGEVLRKNGVTLENARQVVASDVPPQTTDDLRVGMRALHDYTQQLARELNYDLGPGHSVTTSTGFRFDNFEWRLPSKEELNAARARGVMDIRQLVREALEARIADQSPSPWRPAGENALEIVDANGKWVCTAHDIDMRDKILAAVNRKPVEYWRGLDKLTEECGELLQLLGKAGAFPTGDHPDGKGPMGPRLLEELADVKAAIRIFEELNPELSVDTEHDARFLDKLAKFRAWGLRGVPERSP